MAQGSMPDAGAKAPAFSLESNDGQTVKLAGLQGQTVVLYFYPKDDTPGCTTEAKQFRDLAPEFEAQGAVVLGVSPDNTASHCKFIDKYSLNFRLLADVDHKAAEAYGVWAEKNMYGKKYWGVQRATFLIGPDGRVARVWPKVKPDGHAAEVLDAVKQL